MTVHVFGDSHAVACFGRILEIGIHWVGAVTMHRVGRDGADFLFDGVTIRPGDVLVFIFGEIDVRTHIGRIADTTGRPRQELLMELAETYLASIAHAAKNLRDIRIVLTSVVPPSPAHLANTKALPVWGTLEDRIALTITLNCMLADGARRLGYGFLDIYEDYADRTGAMIVGLSDGRVHIAPSHTEPIFRRLQRMIGESLTFLPEDKATKLGIKPRSRLGRAVQRVQFAAKRSQ